jgi:hypothetical protein
VPGTSFPEGFVRRLFAILALAGCAGPLAALRRAIIWSEILAPPGALRE